MISSGSVEPSTPRPRLTPALAAGVAVFAAVSATGAAVGGCNGGGGGGDAALVLALDPDASCLDAPVSCVNELHVLLQDEGGATWREWTLPFAVPGGEASLGEVPDSGDGRFVLTGRAALTGVAPVPLFSGSANVSLTGKDQRVVVPVTCENIPDPCAQPTPTPGPVFATGKPADAVIGQTDFDTCDEDQVNAEDGAIREPDGIELTATHLWIAARNDGRIAVFDRTDIGDLPVPLDFGVGHNTPQENNQGTANDDDMNRARDLAIDGDILYIADTGNHRVHLYSPLPADFSDQGAFRVVGQTNPDGDNNPNDGGAALDTLNGPSSVLPVPGGLFVSDAANHRLLYYTLPIPANEVDAAGLFGQANGSAIQANRGGATARNSLSNPGHLATDGTKLYLADTGNHRVLVWNTIASAAAGSNPDLVIGQADFTSGAANRGGAPASNTLSGPRGVAASPERLVVADSANHRVLVWQPPPTASGAAATHVLGQGDSTSVQPNRGSTNGPACAQAPAGDGGTCPAGIERPTADSLFRPGAAVIEGDVLWVSDTCNNRVLRFTAAVAP